MHNRPVRKKLDNSIFKKIARKQDMQDRLRRQDAQDIFFEVKVDSPLHLTQSCVSCRSFAAILHILFLVFRKKHGLLKFNREQIFGVRYA